MNSSQVFLVNQKDVLELQSYIDNFNPDIIHSHLWETEMLLTNIAHKDSVRFTTFMTI